MKGKANRLEMIKMLISSREMCCQEEILHALQQVGYDITQATLSRDLKQLKEPKQPVSMVNISLFCPTTPCISV